MNEIVPRRTVATKKQSPTRLRTALFCYPGVMKNWRHFLLPVVLTAPFTAVAAAEPVLPRGVQLGMLIGVDPSGRVIVEDVAPDSAATDAGVRKGDALLAIDGQVVSRPTDVVRVGRTLIPGRRVSLQIERSGTRRTMRGTLRARPLESYPDATVRPGVVVFENGLLRTLLVEPRRPASGSPVLFLIQGYPCASVEAPDPAQPYYQLIAALAARGIAVFRVEKPGQGDSRGGPPCEGMEFQSETAAFRAGYAALSRITEGRRIFLFGHSMGGVIAPILAAERSPAGVIVFGTVLRPWDIYLRDSLRLQPFYAANADPADTERIAAAAAPLIQAIYVEGKDPTSVANTANDKSLLTAQLAWDGHNQLSGRDWRYWHQISRTRLAATWKDVKTPVLSLFGEADIAALDDRDHRAIADIVNHYRPGTGTFATMTRTGHAMTTDGTMPDVRARQGQPPAEPMLSVQLVETIATWISQPGQRSEPETEGQ